MSDILTILASTLLTEQPGGVFVNSKENTAAQNIRHLNSGVQPEFRSSQWISVLEVLSGIDIQLREIQLNFQEYIGTIRDPRFSGETAGSMRGVFEMDVKENAISALVENTEKAIQGINQEISDLLLENSKAREFFQRNGLDPVRWNDGGRLDRSPLKSRSQWA